MSLDTTVAPPSKRRTAKSKSKKSKKPEAKRSHDRQTPRPAGPPIEHRDRVLTLQQWADVNNMSLATARRIIDRGEGPPVLLLSLRRKGIRESDNFRWQQSRVTR
jgi:hypothetical protein